MSRNSGDAKASDVKAKSRVFFALWPDAAAAAHLHSFSQQLHQTLGGRLTREETLHATLVFIGDVASDRLPSLRELSAGIQIPAFEINFDSFGCWRHNRIAYLGMQQIPNALSMLQTELASRVRAAGFDIEHRAFSPHITLLRKTECKKAGLEMENPATEPIVWAVRDFVLVKSSLSASGSRYEQIGHWPLL